MSILNKVGDFLSGVLIHYPLSFLPTREQVAVELLNWQRDRLNSWLAQGCVFIMIIPFSMFLNWVFIRDWSSGIAGMLLSILSHSLVVIPAIRGYGKLSLRIQKKIEKLDPVGLIERFIVWWRQPTDPLLRNIILSSIPVIYWILFNYQEWIGYQIGGFVVYKSLRFIMQVMVLFYSNLIFESLSTLWKDREINQLVRQFEDEKGAKSDPPAAMSESFILLDRKGDKPDQRVVIRDENDNDDDLDRNESGGEIIGDADQDDESWTEEEKEQEEEFEQEKEFEQEEEDDDQVVLEEIPREVPVEIPREVPVEIPREVPAKTQCEVPAKTQCEVPAKTQCEVSVEILSGDPMVEEPPVVHQSDPAVVVHQPSSQTGTTVYVSHHNGNDNDDNSSLLFSFHRPPKEVRTSGSLKDRIKIFQEFQSNN
jgi:hypothetical protein